MYITLKNKLIERHSMSEERRIEQLLSQTEMGDKKPSEFYRSMESLAPPPETFDRSLLAKFWLRRLPKELGMALLSSGKTDTTDLLTIADRMWDLGYCSNISAIGLNLNQTSPSEKIIPAIPQPNVPQLVQNSISQISIEAISTLTSAIHEMSTKFANFDQRLSSLQNAQQGRYRSRSRSQSRRRFRSPSVNNSMCWYHRRFGNHARKCIAPCSYKSDDNSKN